MKIIINNIYEFDNIAKIIERTGIENGREDDNYLYLNIVMYNSDYAYKDICSTFKSIESLKIVDDSGKTSFYDQYNVVTNIDHIIDENGDTFTIVLKDPDSLISK